MTTMNRIVRSGMLAAGLAAGFVLAMPAEAASTYEGELDVTLKVVTTQAGVIITGDTDVVFLDASAVGDPGTFASAGLDFEPDDPTVLGAGDTLTMATTFFQGISANGPSLNVATSDVQGEGVVTVENNSGNNAKIVFELTYSLSGTASIDDAAFDAAFLNVLLAVSKTSGSVVSEAITIGLPAGGLTGSDTRSDLLQITIELNNGQSDTISLSTTLSGSATTQPVPLPAALPLFAAGLAAVGLAARRRRARSA